MTNRRPPWPGEDWPRRYGVAILSVLFATVLRRLLDPVLGIEFPYATIFFAVLFTAWYGGFGPALLAVWLGAFASLWFLIPPRGSLAVHASEHQVGFVLYLAVSFGIALLGGAMRAAERRAQQAAGEAGLQVQERTKELRTSEERFRLLVESTTDYAIFLLDAEGHVASWNPGAARIKGYTAEEIIGQHFSRFYTAEDIQAAKPPRELETARREGKYEEEGWRLRKDGSRFWANVLITALRDEAGNIRGFAKITRDLTLRKQAEDDARRLAGELAARQEAERTAEVIRAQREQLRVTLQSIGDAVVVTDGAGKVTLLNPVAEALTGWPQQEAAGQFLPQVFAIKNELTGQPVENPVERVLREGVVVGLANHTVLVARDGTERPIDDSAAPIKDAAGNIQGTVLIFRDVTEKRRGEHAVRESEARKAATLASALDGIVTMDHTGKVIEFNPAAEQMFGYPRAEALGRELADLLIPPSLREQHRRGMARYLVTGEGPVLNQRIEMPALRADGGEFPVELSITRIVMPGPPLFTAHIRDITDRMRHERRRSARLGIIQILAQAPSLHDAGPRILQALGEGLGWDVGGLWVIDAPGDVLRCDAVWHRPGVHVGAFEGISRDSTFARGAGLPGRIWATGEPAWIPDVARDDNFPRAKFAGEAGLHGAFGFPIRHGGKVFGVIEFFSAAVREPDADLLEMVATLGGQAGQFIERQRMQEALLLGENRMRSVVDHVVDGIITIDELGHVESINPAGEKLFGYTRDQVVGQNVKILMPDPYHSEHDHYLHNYRNTGLAKIIGTGREVVGRRQDGSTFPMELAVSAFFIGPRRFFTGIVRDITERKRLEDELHSRLAELADTDRRKDEFLAMLAHELRNPLAPMRNALQILRMPHTDDLMRGRARDIIDRQLHNLIRLVDDLLDVSRIMRGKIELRRERVDLRDVIERAVETAMPTIDAQGHELVRALPTTPVMVEADSVRLAQVVANLLTNAAKYTDQPGPITVALAQEGPTAVLRVTDTGVGIAPALLPQIFDLFVQGDRSVARTQGGLGIGLTLVKRLVELHGGTVAAHSEGLGQGSEFVVRIPVAREAATGTPADEEHNRAASAPRRRVLVVDDNVDAAESLAVLLRLMRHEVRTVYDGPSALEVVRDYQPELVLLDIGLPGMDGYTVARRLRQLPEFEKTRLIAITGYGQDEDRRRAEEAGFDQHLTKPVDPAVLEALISY
ncbi:hypothetical protein AYO44_02825 [Planctomycetaceae bacterium SCGC AG-212-F19]|nr:hypothetical protein AYO44_02825 [Planctomycetaceae bacterium SCGC AG-212-F19]